MIGGLQGQAVARPLANPISYENPFNFNPGGAVGRAESDVFACECRAELISKHL